MTAWQVYPSWGSAVLRARVCARPVIMWLNHYKWGPGPAGVVTHSPLPLISLKLLGAQRGREQTDEEEGNTWHIIGCAQLLRVGAHTATRKTSQKKYTQGTNPPKEGKCILNTAQYVEKERGNQANSSRKLLENRRSNWQVITKDKASRMANQRRSWADRHIALFLNTDLKGRNKEEKKKKKKIRLHPTASDVKWMGPTCNF